MANKQVAILLYHRVLAKADPLRDGDIDLDTFTRHMRVLARYFNVIPLAQLLTNGFTDLPSRAVCITFDDGYRDNYSQALPVLQHLNLPATIFVASGFLNTGRMWNDTVIETLRSLEYCPDLSDLGLGQFVWTDLASKVQACKQLLKALKHLPMPERAHKVLQLAQHAQDELPHDLMLSSVEVQELAQHDLIEIGAHTVNHPILSKLTASVAREEIHNSKHQLEAITQTPVRLFAYPNGRPQQDYNATHVAEVQAAGFIGAVATQSGLASVNSSAYELPRFSPWPESSVRFGVRLLMKYWSK